MLIGVAATPEVAIPTLEWLLTSEHEIVLVISSQTERQVEVESSKQHQ